LASEIELTVIVPTFRECENIGPFLHALCETLDPVLFRRYEVIVMDDDSPERTLEATAEAATAQPPCLLR
jgi:dolichol-phosphate mannosyltransferase